MIVHPPEFPDITIGEKAVPWVAVTLLGVARKVRNGDGVDCPERYPLQVFVPGLPGSG